MLSAAVRLVSAFNGYTLEVDAIVLWATSFVGFALDVDASVSVAFVWVFARADLGVSVAMIGSSAGNGNALVGFTSALTISATRNHRLETVVVRCAIDWFASVVLASFLRKYRYKYLLHD